MKSSTDPHTSVLRKSLTLDRSLPSPEAKTRTRRSLDEINDLISSDVAIVSCPVVVVNEFSTHYPKIDVDKLFSDHREVRLALTIEDNLIIKDLPTQPHEVVKRVMENKISSFNSILM